MTRRIEIVNNSEDFFFIYTNSCLKYYRALFLFTIQEKSRKTVSCVRLYITIFKKILSTMTNLFIIFFICYDFFFSELGIDQLFCLRKKKLYFFDYKSSNFTMEMWASCKSTNKLQKWQWGIPSVYVLYYPRYVEKDSFMIRDSKTFPAEVSFNC